MRAEVLLAARWLLAVAAQMKSPCHEQAGLHVEAVLLQDCVMIPKGYNQADVECFAIERSRSQLLPKAGVIKATVTLHSNLSLWTVRERIWDTCESLHNVSFDCCYQYNRNETSSHSAHDVSKLRRISQINEPIIAQIGECARDHTRISCSVKVFIPLSVKEDVADKPNIYNKSQSTCRVSIETSDGAISDSALATNVTFLGGTQNMSQILQSHDAFKNATRVVIYGCSFDTFVIGDLKLAPNLQHVKFYDTSFKNSTNEALELPLGVQKLSFLMSRMSSIPQAIFSIDTLQSLSVKHTVIGSKQFFSIVPPSPMKNSSITNLNLKGTALYSLADRAFCNFPMLENLNLQLCSLKMMYGSPFICLRRLKYLKLKNNELTTITNDTFQGLVSLRALKLTKNRIAFHDPTPVFAPLVSLNILHLGDNRIDVLFPEIFVSLSVTKLTLALNYISAWSAPIFSRMTYLDNLRLDGNKIHVLDDNMYKDVANVSNVHICYNPWECTNCDIKNVQLFLLETGRNHCCVDCVVCSDGQGSLSDIPVMDAAPGTEKACQPPDYYVVIGVPIIMILLLGSVTSYAVYTKRWYIRYFLLFIRVKAKAYKRLRSADRFLWDAFVSYHHSDAEWVHEHIVPTLESTALRFRLCVAERDFIPGLPIAENVCRGIAQSRKSLFVLSSQFSASRWCMFELTLAQHRLFESDRENQMVFIRREPMDESTLCPLLSYLLRTKTYVQAPPEDADESVRHYFWLQLRAALEL
ncbi:toll-like receptor 4 [Dermacentor albipictus]|uniref:toll-like receptor 4 n=1 Tax=Dermacentor albipictus TaxID=60249 RepID=UPI0038FD0504